MAEQDKEQHLDKLLDSLLAGYSDAAPRPGLETRLLANLRAAEQQKSTSWRWSWLLAGAAAAVIFALAVAIHLRQAGPLRLPDNREMVKTREQAPVVSHGSQSPELPPVLSHDRMPAEQSPAISHGVHPLQHRAVRSHPSPAQQTRSELARAPRLEVFPTPMPLSDQEKLLLHYMARTPREEIVAHSRPDEEVPENPGPGQPFQQIQIQQPTQQINTR